LRPLELRLSPAATQGRPALVPSDNSTVADRPAAGLIQTSPAARQLNFLGARLGGEPFGAHSSTWVNCVSVAASALGAQV
jgi:hypothetical protein